MLDLSRVEHRLCVPVFCFASLFAVSTPSMSHLLLCEMMISKLEAKIAGVCTTTLSCDLNVLKWWRLLSSNYISKAFFFTKKI